MKEALKTILWQLLGGRTTHYEIAVPDQSEIVYRDSLKAVIERGGAL